jgi:hypothetical protein
MMKVCGWVSVRGLAVLCIIRIRVLGSSGEMGEGDRTVLVRPPPVTGAHVHRIQPGRAYLKVSVVPAGAVNVAFVVLSLLSLIVPAVFRRLMAGDRSLAIANITGGGACSFAMGTT